MATTRATTSSRLPPALRTALKVAVPLVCTLASLAALKMVATQELISPAQMSRWVAAAGTWGPLAFIAALAIRPLVLLPGQVFTAVAGMLWGAVGGTAVALVGSWLAMLVVVKVGRRLLRRPIARWSGAKGEQLAEVARRHDLIYGVLVTLNPLLPTDVCIAVAAGAGARLGRLTLGALLGTIPGTIATASFGNAIVKDQPMALVLSAAGIVVSTAGGAVLFARVFRALRAEPVRVGASRPAAPRPRHPVPVLDVEAAARLVPEPVPQSVE